MPKSKESTQPKNYPSLGASIAHLLLQILFGPFVLYTLFFFACSLALLFGLVYCADYPKWLLLLIFPAFLVSVAVSFRIRLKKTMPSSDGHYVYDKAKYHLDDDFLSTLPEEQAFVPTGMFVGWLIEHDLIAPNFLEETKGFKERKITGPKIYEAWDGCLVSDILTDTGNRFAHDYFDFDSGQYLRDYEEILAQKLPSLFHVADTWENYDALKKKIGARFEDWKKKKR